MAGDQEPVVVCQYLVNCGANANCFVYMSKPISFLICVHYKRKLWFANKSEADNTFCRNLHANPSRHLTNQNTRKTFPTLNLLAEQCKNMTCHKTSQFCAVVCYWILNGDWFKLAIPSFYFLPVSYLCLVYLSANKHSVQCVHRCSNQSSTFHSNEKS